MFLWILFGLFSFEPDSSLDDPVADHFDLVGSKCFSFVFGGHPHGWICFGNALQEETHPSFFPGEKRFPGVPAGAHELHRIESEVSFLLQRAMATVAAFTKEGFDLGRVDI